MSQIFNLPKQKKKRKYLRNNATRSEKALWQKLKNKKIGFKFRRQCGIKNYIVDFYCPELKLIIEIDGEVHDIECQIRKDYVRDLELKKLGLRIIRFSNYDINFELIDVIKRIKEACLSNHPNPSLDKEGKIKKFDFVPE